MCGLAVAVNWDGAEEAVRSLIAGIMHRGDVTDPLVSPRPKTAMATRRLRIVDPDHGAQPISSFDGALLVSFNGEIYNHGALRTELEALGVPFRTHCDTEVLASALRFWGLRALERLEGMFAFVAIDVDTGGFIAARDRWGIKPLYLMQSATGFLFCSEMAPLLRTVDRGDVLLMPPGHVLTPRDCARFAPAIPAPDDARAGHDPGRLDDFLEAAVRRRLPPDLPFALMFSGGIDSTLLAHYARQSRPEAPAYVLGGPRTPDYPYAAEYAARAGMDLRCVPLEDGTPHLAAALPDVVQSMETFEPSVIRPSLGTYLLARRIREDGFKVALSGEGADELFAGYPPLELAYADSQLAGSYVRDQLLGAMHRTGLQRIDRCGMRFGLEVREAFLDAGVASYALSLERRALVDRPGGAPRGKAALRGLYDLYPDRLPASIRDRRKLAMDEGCGFSPQAGASLWAVHAEDTVSDRDFTEGKAEFQAFGLRGKEELLYIRALAERLDPFRVPHLRDRLLLRVPEVVGAEKLDRVAQ